VNSGAVIAREWKTERFKTTRWSIVLSSVDWSTGQKTAQAALSQLCQIYWRPIFAFIHRQGFSVPDAQDLTQDFLLLVLEGSLLQRADPNRGRFRSLLLKSLQHFLADVADRKSARKRGGDVQFISWDDWIAEAPSQLSVPSEQAANWTPERTFDIRWAATLAERALRRLSEECAARGRRRVFDIVSSCLTAERADISYSALSARLRVGDPAVKRLVHGMRRRYRTLLREEVAETVERCDDVEEEIRYLCAALAANGRNS
jgi:DNA-directed RNA polymerase specialized sigma24 family protein